MFQRLKNLVKEVKWRAGFTPLCSVCGERQGKHYFGTIEIPRGKGEHIKVGETTFGDVLNTPMDVVKWTGEKEQVEYFECEKCFKGEED
ncbi:hypothetical protein AKJ51_04990 [candidate division MSBL1 archaeon SCGC-AAA382A20]|uniref:Uncharacterized protein n=1 Tax=candidate division MSBL1 archaeon SCGC-AAA382A20 TaxID=1698280 RepID=A0A133VGB8_9EURY|nr:hypothetical protein AKJ51_04990 [candidate division MSBL1 archaeon SCGC-AAA382A20]